MSDGTLAALGWTDELEAAFTTYAERGFMPARVVAEHRGGYYVRSELGDRLASARGRLRDDELWGGMPAVGDWVVVCDAPGERFAIEALLPRRTKVSRKTPWLKAEEHILVANVDTVLLVAGLDADFNPRRLERYLTAAWDSRRRPGDRAHEARRLRRPRQARRGGDGRGRRAGLRGEQRHGRGDRGACARCSSRRRRSSCSGSSGNREVDAREPARRPNGDGDGRAAQATGAAGTRRGTASSSSCPSGAILIDTPGLRELQVWEGDIDSAFADIAELAAQCKFNDCAHSTEPDCAVREALETGELDEGRWANYVKLQRELRAIEARSSRRIQRELKSRWRARARETRRARRYGGKP